MTPITIHVDGGTAGTRHAGIAAIATNKKGRFLGWLSQQLPTMTNNEAEYRATLLRLTLAQQLQVTHVEIVSDSEVVVRQMKGLSRVHSSRLKPLHQQTCQAITTFTTVQFRHVRRHKNRLADALASNAIDGNVVAMPMPKRWWQRSKMKE